jgi:LysR family hydrogen peroxide-inducible transcriptional activator
VVPHSFSLRQLQYAAAVADTGGFRRAAQLCRVSQPSLSAQLAQLEEALGVRLFERDRRRVLVTAAGAEVLVRARRVLLEAEDLMTASTRLRDPLCGTLRVGIIPTVSPYLLPEITPAIRARYPRLTVRWAEEKTAVVLRSLREGGLDAGLLALVPGMEGLDRQVIADDPFVLAGAPSEPLLKLRRPARVEELEGASLLLLEDGHCFRDQALTFCEGANVFEEAGYRATSLATLARMAAGGAGLTLLPELSLAVENRHRELAIRPFARPAPKRTLVLAWRAQSPLATALRQIAATLVPILKTAPSVPRGRRRSSERS